MFKLIDGREFAVDIADSDKAKKLAELLKINPDDLVDESDIQELKKMLDLINLAFDDNLNSLSERLDSLDDDMKELGIESAVIPSSVDIGTIADLLIGMKEGKAGIAGKDGKDGINGKDSISVRGTNGHDGKDGKDGKDGEDGKDGKDLISTEKNHPNQELNRGYAGEKGEAGEKGTSIIGARFNEFNELVFELDVANLELNAGTIPTPENTTITTDPFQVAKMRLISEIGTRWTLPSIDKAVFSAKKADVQGVDQIVEFARNQL